MRLAFFSSIVPDGRPTSGFEIANEAILEGLRSLGHEVVSFGFALPRQNLAQVRNVGVIQMANLENAHANRVQKLRWVLQALRTGLPISASKLRSVSFEHVRQVVEAEGRFDLHVLNSYQMAAAFPELTAKPFVFAAHNVEYRTAAENAQTASSRVDRFLYRRDARLLQTIETDLCARARHVWVLSQEDATAFGLGHERVNVLPLVVPQRKTAEQKHTKAFDFGMVGTWTWAANRVGLDWFLTQVVPQLPPSVNIAIAGAKPDNLRSPPNVTMLGRVDDAEQFIRSVRIVPLISRAGTGIQLKTIEAFQAGLPCVATSSSLRGVADLPVNCRSSDDPGEFAQAMMEQLEQQKENRLPLADGAEFRTRQKAELENSLKQGLKRIAL